MGQARSSLPLCNHNSSEGSVWLLWAECNRFAGLGKETHSVSTVYVWSGRLCRRKGYIFSTSLRWCIQQSICSSSWLSSLDTLSTIFWRTSVRVSTSCCLASTCLHVSMLSEKFRSLKRQGWENWGRMHIGSKAKKEEVMSGRDREREKEGKLWTYLRKLGAYKTIKDINLKSVNSPQNMTWGQGRVMSWYPG